jgi:uncharacterized protein YcaQ
VTGSLSLPAARRIALAAQGFAAPRPTGRIDVRHLRQVIARIGLLQLDSVNVLSRSHYLPVFSRLGPYSRDLLDSYAWGPRRELFEYWAHEASLLPMATQPLLRWRMERSRRDAWGGIRRAGDDEERVAAALAAVRRLGPAGASELGEQFHPDARAQRVRNPGAMWNWDDAKRVMEFLFWSGQVTAGPRVHFQRLYDVPERVLPSDILAADTPTAEQAQRELLMIGAAAMGVATEPDLRDYFRLPAAESKLRLAELVEDGRLLPIAVRGWAAPAYLHPGAARPRRVAARALLSPFDSLIWFRDRALRLFDFRFRLEIYTPAAKRVHGYYVLPFLLGEELVGRVDLAADRREGLLRVHAAFAEPFVHDGGRANEVAAELAAELRTMAGWLGLSDVAVGSGGDLAAPLARALAAG